MILPEEGGGVKIGEERVPSSPGEAERYCERCFSRVYAPKSRWHEKYFSSSFFVLFLASKAVRLK